MTAAFGFDLIFKMNSRRTFTDHFPHGLLRIVPASVSIYEQRKFRRARDAAHINQHIIQSSKADVWNAVTGVRDACAGKIERTKACTFRENGGISVNDACELERANFSRANLSKADLRTVIGYSIDPTSSTLQGARFSKHNLEGLVTTFGLKLE